MYCPSCGSEQIQGLKYCNRCGANLAPADNPAPPTGVVWAVSLATIFVSLGGFIMTFIFAMEFMSRGDSTTGSLVFLVFFLIVVLAISALLIKQLSRLLNAYLKSGDAKTKRASLINELPTAQLAAPLEPVPPVVEQTTRRFEPSHREQKQ